jgi:hypothetical protein
VRNPLTPRCNAKSIVLLAMAVCFVLQLGENSFGQSRRTRRPALPQRPAIDYSQFSHTTSKHQQACKTCHKVPTDNWQKSSSFPDVADYPDHDACMSCHRRQFFRGARPSICSVCHSRVSPRDDARFAFRNPARRRQFVIEFPHDRHQDVIAKLQPVKRATPFFVRAAFTIPSQQQQKSYNNCEICHAALTSLPSAPTSGWSDGFIPDQLTFKAVPVDHAACFNCHWKSEEPVNENCGGCHKLAASSITPAAVDRISMKFRHEGGGERKNHVAECTTCHIHITKSATLRGLKPDVPITSCTECHNKPGLRLDVTNELEAIDKNREFVCVYCHTADVGRRDPPSSHYLIAGREPRKRSN